MNSLRRSLLAAAFTVIASGVSHAQFITWLGANGISGYTDVFTTGTYVDGFQTTTGGFNGRTTSAQTVNGVVFNVNNSYTFSDSTFSITGDVSDGTDGDYPYYGDSANATYMAVLADCAYTGSTATVTMSGLTVGQEYEIEVWNSTPYDDTILQGSTLTDTQYLDVGQYTLGTFIAGATNSFTFVNGPDHSGVGTIDALEIREIPEPSTYALLSLGAAAMFFIARRRLLVS